MMEQRTLTIDLPIRDIGFNAFEIKVVKGPDKGLRRFFKKREVIVGTSRGSDLPLTDPTVSHRHFSITFDGYGLKLRDLNSRNGTLIGPLKVVEVYLTENTVISAGETRLKLSFKNERVNIPVVEGTHFGNMVGSSYQMREVFAKMKRAATSDVTVLLQGESGTGKEVAARALHEFSNRRKGAFVVFDCAAVSRELAESALFGHVKGAFTGAVSDRKGAVREADKGTLFLDEIGELPMELQATLLRLLESREVKPVGMDHYITVDTRIIAATNKNLQAMVKEGTFREDLYFRLAVLKIEIPPLRKRKQDIPLLVNTLIDEIVQRYGIQRPELSQEDMELLNAHSWPGNVRELKNYLETLVVMGEANINPDTDPNDMDGFEPLLNLPYRQAKEMLLHHFDQQYFSRLLSRTRGNITKAADIAGVHRKTIEYILKKHRKKT